MTAKMNGVIKWFNVEKGFGFIVPDNGGGDVFVHIEKVKKSGLIPEHLRDGTPVSFTLREYKGKNQAEELQLI